MLLAIVLAIVLIHCEFDDKRWIGQKQTEEPGQELAYLGLSAGPSGPAQRGSVVCNIDEDWVWVVGDAWCWNDVKWCAVVDNDGDELENIDED